MKRESEIWLFVGLLAILAFTTGEAIEEVDMPSPYSTKIQNAIKAAGIDTTKYDDVISMASSTFSVPIAWIKAVIGRESSFRENPPVRPGDASYGLMQLTPKTAIALGFSGSIPDDLIHPDTNIYFGTMLLGQLRAAHGDDFQAVYSAYNSGSATKYQTSTQVATNVQHAEEWLQYFQTA